MNQIPNCESKIGFGHWISEIGIYLGFGICNLEFGTPYSSDELFL
jgi:hypothetical protein